jgi:predicted phosphoribosyltransferase
MPSVAELCAPYENFLASPRAGPGVCVTCFNFTDGYERCFACEHGRDFLATMAPISYSIGGEQLHHALASYKRLEGEVARRLTVGLAAILWRWLELHEPCVARAAGVAEFGLVTTVPSSKRSGTPPLGHAVGELVAPTRERYRPLLIRSEVEVPSRAFSPEKYLSLARLDDEPVLLIDDTWTTGANAQSAAASLRAAGAGLVAAVVIGRHVNRGWHDTDRRLRSLRQPFEWSECALCAATRAPTSGSHLPAGA